MKDLKDMTRPELDALIDNYRGLSAADGTELEVPAAFENKGECLAFLAKAAKEWGIPHEITDADLEAHPEYKEAKLEAGDVILIASEPEAPAISSAEENKPSADQPADPVVPHETPTQPVAPDSALGLGVSPSPRHQAQKFHRRQLVTREQTKIQNGRLYHEISTVEGSTFLLTPDEYKAEVSEA